MQQHNQNIRNKLYKHGVAPPDSVWRAIEKDLPGRSHAPMAWLWGLLGVLALIAAAYFFWPSEEKVVPVSSVKETIAELTDKQAETYVETETVAKISEDIEKNQSTPESKNVTSATDQFSKKKSQINSTDTKINDLDINKVGSIAAPTASNDIINADQEIKETALIETQPTVTGNLTETDKQKEITRAEGNVAATRDIAALFQLSTIKPQEEITSLMSAPLVSEKLARRILDKCNYLSAQGTQGCYDFNGPKGETAFYLDILGGADIHNRTLTARSPAEFQEYADLRNSTETSELSWSMMARASLVTESGLAFRTGFLYSQTQERFEASRRVTQITLDTINGVPTIDTVSGVNTVTTYNKLRYLELPFMIGYEVQQDRLTLGVNAGAALGLSFTQRGRILSPSDQIVDISSDNNNRFPAFAGQAGLSAIGSVMLGYEITPRMQLIVEPNVRYRLGSVTLDSYPLEQKYLTYSVWAGLRFKL